MFACTWNSRTPGYERCIGMFAAELEAPASLSGQERRHGDQHADRGERAVPGGSQAQPEPRRHDEREHAEHEQEDRPRDEEVREGRAVEVRDGHLHDPAMGRGHQRDTAGDAAEALQQQQGHHRPDGGASA